MPEISDDVDIDATPEAVWAVLADVRRLPDYSSSTVAMQDAPAELTEKGQTFTQVVKVVGRRWKSHWKVLELRRGDFLCTEGTVGPGVKFQLSQTLVGSKDRTTLTLKITYNVPGGALGELASKAGLERRAKVEAKSILVGIRDAAQSGEKATA